jgi:hypothetical protein
MLKVNNKKEIKVYKVKKKVLIISVFNIRLVLSQSILWQSVYKALNKSYSLRTCKKTVFFNS